MEFIRWFRLYRKKQHVIEQAQNGQLGRRLVFYVYIIGCMVNYHCRLDLNLLGDGSLHAVQLTLSYMLMLVFMTFNVWLCASVILGEVLSRIIFSLFFPQLERLNDALATNETCCG
jgi:hypothetical protein